MVTCLVPSIAFIIAKWRPTRGAAADQTGKKLGVGSGSRGEHRWERGEGVMRAQLTHSVDTLAIVTMCENVMGINKASRLSFKEFSHSLAN